MDNDINNLKDVIEHFITHCSKVFIIGHNNPDLDAISSAIGLAEICKALKKDAYIIINENDDKSFLIFSIFRQILLLLIMVLLNLI